MQGHVHFLTDSRRRQLEARVDEAPRQNPLATRDRQENVAMNVLPICIAGQ